MGYNAGGTYFENHRSSGFDTVANDVSCVVELTRSKRQVRMMQTNPYDIQTEEGLAEQIHCCREWYSVDVNQTAPTFTSPEQALPCPPTLQHIKLDTRFENDTRFRNATNTTICYLQRFSVLGSSTLGPLFYGRQCCYHTGDG